MKVCTFYYFMFYSNSKKLFLLTMKNKTRSYLKAYVVIINTMLNIQKIFLSEQEFQQVQMVYLPEDVIVLPNKFEVSENPMGYI